jgi:glycosyltransferase involved in cell wall biosynthesis
MSAVVSHVLKLYRRLLRRKAPPRQYPFIRNVNGVHESTLAKRALLLYLTDPFVLGEDAPQWLRHQNLRRCKLIARVLGELGYVVDAGNGRAPSLNPPHEYDLMLTDQADRVNDGISLKRNGKRIFIATSINYAVHNRNVQQRHKRLLERRPCDVSVRRVYSEKMRFAREADVIIGPGNDTSMATWREISEARIYGYNNSGWNGTVFQDDKDYDAARRRFLFFASRSQIQKGLDLLLEIFRFRPELDLYVCSDFLKEGDFCACYRNELLETPNIHAIGWTTVNSPEFYRLARECAYVIHPSCSEGQAGSVIQCMHAGLIPLVTRESGIDLEDCGVTFADDSIQEIERVILQVAKRPGTWHRGETRKVRNLAEREYNEEAVRIRLREIFADVLVLRHADYEG